MKMKHTITQPHTAGAYFMLLYERETERPKGPEEGRREEKTRHSLIYGVNSVRLHAKQHHKLDCSSFNSNTNQI